MATKTEVKRAFDITTDAALARLFGIGRWAVGQWPENEPIPELRELQLRERFPHAFDAKGRIVAAVKRRKVA